ncbi:O-antigen ligase family protein [uncultured Gimesia sp.]|uniref:O-antigen ligase family protein n=1 Tax=uncultured Gimesia sp. TaxID=1678688 RepID=UPI0030DB1506
MLCWLLSGQYRVTFELLKRYRVATVALLFFAVLAVSLLYTPESLKHGARNLFKYRQFLMIPVYLSFFLDPKARQRGVQMFGLAMLLTLIASLSCWVFEIQGSARLLDHAVFKNRITQNILMAFLVYLSAWKFLEKPRQHWFYFVLALIAAINVIAMVPGRSGYLALGILTCLLMYQKLGFKSIVPAVICLGVVGGLAYSQSATFQKRINQVFTEIKEYKIAQIRRSGVNLRIEFYENSLHLAKSNPLLGSGTGSFGMKYKQLAEQNQQISTSNPHNEYMMLLVQNGIIGVGLFLSFFWSAWRSTRLMTGLDRALGQAVLAVYFVVCMVNSLMLDTTEGSLFGFLVGLTFAGGASALSRGGDSVPIVSSSDDEEPPVVCDAA